MVFVLTIIFVLGLVSAGAVLAGSAAQPSAVCLGDNGWSQPVGTWDPATRTATLTRDLKLPVRIEGDSLTLDGNGHVIAGNGGGDGVYCWDEQASPSRT